MSNPGKIPLLFATLRLGDFPLGSMESRAAARTEVERIKRMPKPMLRLFENGVLQKEHACDGMEGDISVYVEHVGREQ